MQQRDSAMSRRIVELGPVVVTGSGHHQHLRSTATPVHVISQDDIRQRGAATFQEAITSLLPQVSVAPNSMGSFLRMNGLGNKYVLVLVNGKRIIGDISGNVDLSRINMSRVRRIEVLDGAASSLYGSDAIGGVINIITDQPTKDLVGVDSDTRLSGSGQFKQSVNVDIHTRGFGSYTSWHHDRADSYRTNDYEYVKGNEGETQQSIAPLFPGYRSHLLNQRFTFSPHRRLALHVEGQYGWKRTSRPDSRAEVPGGFDYEMRCKSWRWNAGAVYKLGKRHALQLDFVSDDYEYGYDYEVATKAYAIGDYVMKKQQHYYEGELKGIFHFQEQSTTIVGADYRNDFLNAQTGNVHNHVYTLAGYAQHEQPLLPKLKATMGLRYSYHEMFGHVVTPKVAMMYTIIGDATNPTLIARGTYSRGFRSPGLDELYYHYNTYLRGVSTITVGNKDLKAEQSNYFSLSMEYNTPLLSVSLTGYANAISDMIVKQYIPVDETSLLALRQEFPEITDAQAARIDHYGKYTNSDRGRVYGVQVNLSAQPFAGLTLTGNYSYTYARTETDGHWEALERSIRNTATLGAHYQHRWGHYLLGINLNGRLQSKTYYGGKYENAPGFGIWSIHTTHDYDGWKWAELQPSIGIDNLFNRVDRRIDSDTRRYALYSPGRMLVVGLKVRFKQQGKK